MKKITFAALVLGTMLLLTGTASAGRFFHRGGHGCQTQVYGCQTQVYHQTCQQVYHQTCQQVYHQPCQQVYHQTCQQVYHQPCQQAGQVSGQPVTRPAPSSTDDGDKTGEASPEPENKTGPAKRPAPRSDDE